MEPPPSRRGARSRRVCADAVASRVGFGMAGGLSTVVVILLTGVAVIGAAFILTWAAETAEIDVPRSVVLAVLAIVAVAPEYAVDALYA